MGQIINCDSLNNSDPQPIYCHWYHKLPETKKDTLEIVNEFKQLIDTNLVEKSIYVKLNLDSLGNVQCVKILQGNDNITDTITLDYCMNMKFYPAETKGEKKVESQIAFELFRKVN